MQIRYFIIILTLIICSGGGTQGIAQGMGSTQDQRKIEIFDLAQVVRNITKTESDKYDYSSDIGGSKNATLHLHLLGFSQTTPLHLHHNSEEATIVVTGKPHVTQYFGRDGKLAKVEGDYDAGSLIYSPRLCGHKWKNMSNNSMQANLVIASPPFVGNFYIDQTEPLLKTAPPGMIVRSVDDFQKWLKTSKNPMQAEKLSMMNGRMLRVFLRKQIHIPPARSTTVVYIIRGKGSLQADRTYPLEAQNLVMIPPMTALALDANQDAPMAIIAFRPEAPWDPLPTQ